MKPIFLSLVSVAAVVLGAGGLITLFLGLKRALRSARTRQWATAPGTVVTSQLLEQVTTDAQPQRTLYSAKVTYRYEANGRPFVGGRVKLDEVQTSSAAKAGATVARFVPGAEITVHFDPKTPDEAVLEPGISAASGLVPGVGAGLILLSLAMWAIVRLWAGW